MQVNVIAVHNTAGEVKPLYVVLDGTKRKIDKVNHVVKAKDVTLFNVTVGGQIIVLCFDGLNWSVG
jgi:hypothetical protein